MFGTLLILVAALMQFYVAARAATLGFFQRPWAKRGLWASAAGLWLLVVLGRAVRHGEIGSLSVVAEAAGMAWFGTLFLLSTCLLAADIATGFGLWARSLLRPLRAAALGAGVALSLAALVQGHREPAITEYEVSLPGLPPELDGTVLAVLSDTHLGSHLGPAWLDARGEQVRAMDPDAILLAGDILEGHGGEGQGLRAALSKLYAPLGVWAVNGNHEHYGRGNAGGPLEASGIRLLRDAWGEAAPGLVIAGVEDRAGQRREDFADRAASRALVGKPPGAVVLLSHAPTHLEEAAAAGAGLILCGHTHGGQLWPFGYLVALRYPHLEGYYEVGGAAVLVGRGTGTWGPRMRLWRRGEILKVTLRSPRARSARGRTRP